MASSDTLPVVHRPGVLWADVEGEVVVYDGAVGRAVLLSSTGSLLWPALSSPVTIRELASDVADVFEISPGEALDQVGAFVGQLLDNGLLQVTDEGVERA